MASGNAALDSTIDTTRPAGTRSRLGVWATTLGAAVLPPVALWIVTVPVAGHDLIAKVGGSDLLVSVASVVFGALVATASGLGLMTLLRRFTTHARRIWLIVTPIALVLSLSSPLGGTTAATVLLLASMHLLVGTTVIIGGLALPGKRTKR